MGGGVGVQLPKFLEVLWVVTKGFDLDKAYLDCCVCSRSLSAVH